MSGSPLQLVPGTIFAGDFRIEGPLRTGGMGAVYIATQLSTGTRRAIKVMLPSLVADDAARRRFEQEARVGSRIPSEHVVQVIAAGIDESSQAPWLAMELLQGEELEARIRRSGPMSRDGARELFAQLGHAIGAAHRARIVHRDLKPENVFLALPRTVGAAPFTVKVLDFGIAKVASETVAANTGIMGTPIWMAPEQTEPGHDISATTDVWALGLIAYYVMTGRSFWRAASDTSSSLHALMREMLFDRIAPASERAAEQGIAELLPSGFDPWFARCVTRDAVERYANADDAVAALDSILRGGAANVSEKPGIDPVADRPPGLPRKMPAAVFIAAGTGLLAAAAIVTVGLALRPGKRVVAQEAIVADPRRAIAEGATSWADLVLPLSATADEPYDPSGVAVVVTPRWLLAGNPPRRLFALDDDRAAGAPGQYKEYGRSDSVIVPLASALRSAHTRRLVVMADATTPYRLLWEVLHTSAQADYSRWDFVASRDGRPRSFAVYAPASHSATAPGSRRKIIVTPDEFEAYVNREGDGGTPAWAPLSARCDREGATMTALRHTGQLEECVANIVRAQGRAPTELSAESDVSFGRVIAAIDRIRAASGEVEFGAPE